MTLSIALHAILYIRVLREDRNDVISDSILSQVTLRMYGLSPKEKTTKLPLRKPASRFMFMRDSTHTFSITAPNFKEISSIEMEVRMESLRIWGDPTSPS